MKCLNLPLVYRFFLAALILTGNFASADFQVEVAEAPASNFEATVHNGAAAHEYLGKADLKLHQSN